MRQSAFNHIVPLPEGGFALYNFLTGNCMRLNALSRDYYDNFELYGENCPQRRREGKKECSPVKLLLDEYVIALARKLMNRVQD